VGNYECGDEIIEIIMNNEGALIAKIPNLGNNELELVPYKSNKFTLKEELSFIKIEFIMDSDEVKILNLIFPQRTFEHTKK
jgi:hypothetical protein